MPVLMLRSKIISCPECNPKNLDDGIKLFQVDGDGRMFYFCSNCLGEFKVENEKIIQTKKMEKEEDSTITIQVNDDNHEKSESEINISEKMTVDETSPEPSDNDIKSETGSEIDK